MEDAARITEEEWNIAISLLSKQVQQTTSILKAAGIQARLMPSEGLIETLYWWFNPKSYTDGVRPPGIDAMNPRPITSYFVHSPLEVDTKHGWLRMDGMYRRIVYMHEPPTTLQFGMLLPQLLAPGFVSGAFSVECRSSDAPINGCASSKTAASKWWAVSRNSPSCGARSRKSTLKSTNWPPAKTGRGRQPTRSISGRRAWTT
jgi:hypothetical protein